MACIISHFGPTGEVRSTLAYIDVKKCKILSVMGHICVICHSNDYEFRVLDVLAPTLVPDGKYPQEISTEPLLWELKKLVIGYEADLGRSLLGRWMMRA